MFDLTLYLVADNTGLEESIFLEKIEQVCRGGIILLQLREKEKSGREYFELVRKVKSVSNRYHVPLIIDNRADVATVVDAARVHVGQSDLPVFATRVLLSPDKIVGATAKTVGRAQRATREGAGCLGVGAIYPTTAKVKTVLTSVSTLDEACRSVSIPVATTGGLSEGNCDILWGVLIAGISVVSAVMEAADPCRVVAELRAEVTGFSTSQS